MSTRADKISSKVTRAKQHVEDFQLGLSAFYDTNPYRVLNKPDADKRERIYFLAGVEEVPDSLITIATDVIQNLRSPLDQIVYQLVLDANNGSPPDKDVVYYPITSAASEYPALRARNIQGVRQEVVDAIDASEPYPGGKGHALWQLNALNKFDKHRLLVAAGSSYGSVDISETFRSIFRSMGPPEAADAVQPLFIRPADNLCPLKVGDELYSEPLDERLATDPAIKDKRQFRFHVAFSEAGITDGEPAIKTLHDMANLVDDIVTRLGRFLK